ncbi:MAG: hypothetical protein ACE5IK_11715 [Acidobacteriota bacterium]
MISGVVLTAGIGLGAPARAQEAPGGGGAPGPAFLKTFAAELAEIVTYREEVRLDVNGASAQSSRTAVDMAWTLTSPNTALRASLTPYYEVFSENGLATYGGAAGLGMERQASPRLSWTLRSTVVVAPEQDVSTPQTTPQPAVRELRVLVPRNGFVASTLGASLSGQVSPRATLGVGTSYSSTSYNAFSVERGAPAPASLADQERVGISATFGRDLTPTSAWSIQGAAARTTLSGGTVTATTGSDQRDQLSLTGGYSKTLAKQSVAAHAGFSTIDSGARGKQGTAIVDLTWSRSGERIGFSLAARRAQGVFAAERVSADGSSVVGSLGWQLPGASRLGFNAEYGISQRSASGSGEVRSRGVSALYTWTGRSLTWTATVASGRQRSDAGFGRNLDSMTASVSMAWRFAGRGVTR